MWVLFGTILVGLVVLTAWGGLWLWGREGKPGVGYVTLDLQQGTSANAARQLAQAGLIESQSAFEWYVEWVTPLAELKPGKHWLPRGSTPQELVALLARTSRRPIKKVLIPEGFDVFQVAARMAEQGICSAEGLRSAALNTELAQELVGQRTFEGYLFPATYELRVDSSPSQVLKKLSAEASRRWHKVFQTHSQALHQLTTKFQLDAHGALVLASVVEREASSPAEFGAIASVFLNRLSDPDFRPLRMLQSDPTAGYGCKLYPSLASCAGYRGKITPSMLRDKNNPYNTYQHPGLPPGPISNPSEAALMGVLNAPETDYLFFVAGAGGKHIFSRTLADHRRAIRRR